MHSLAPYTIRSYEPNYFKLKKQYPPLDKILGRFDLYILFKDFLNEQGTDFHLNEPEKKIFRFLDLKFNDETRIIQGYLEQGHYGLKADIINIELGTVDYEKTEKNAELIKYYFYLKIPVTYNEGLALFQVYKNVSAKTLIFNILLDKYKLKTDLNLQFNSLSDLKSLEKWKDAQVKEIKLTKFNPIQDRAQKLMNLGHKEIDSNLSIRPKTGNFGPLRSFYKTDSDQFKAVEVWEEQCAQVKTVVNLNGKNRTFTVGKSKTLGLCEIEAPDNLEIDGGLPTNSALELWFDQTDKDLSKELYKP
ncbi:hypothetical protein A7P54_03730 [Acinetobacter sp. Ac_3412]|uniref:hypothetical protein n=1 Tax=Acinetobacter sp. Ac_3412 TaxID=1848935 RepID=UPI0014906C04|nr:hypothetical protein [Acinetobacter sp. Ac_3412]NNP75529.1 hypothetical protein [Acinetobacter sp. Ac_3412]